MSFIHISNLLTQMKQRSLAGVPVPLDSHPLCSPGRHFNNFCSNILTMWVFPCGFPKPSCLLISKSQNHRRVEARSDLWKLPKHRQQEQVACNHAQSSSEYLQGHTHSGQPVSSVQSLSHWKVNLKFIYVALCFTPVCLSTPLQIPTRAEQR